MEPAVRWNLQLQNQRPTETVNPRDWFGANLASNKNDGEIRPQLPCSRYQTQLQFAVQEQCVNGRRHNVFVPWEELLLGA